VRSWGPSELRAALATHGARREDRPGFGHAAVLVPLFVSPDEGLSLLFTVRAAGLSRHAGQIAFPGGRLEAGEGPLEAALREAYEEVGLSVSSEDVLGRLDDRVSPFGLIATPFLAYLPAVPCCRIDPGEVAEVFTLPLAAFLSARREVQEVHHGAEVRRLMRYYVGEREVWGMTGNIVHDLLERLQQAPPW
jgi:8-oxo-dGTP pyrophosphatase MutT (NUDIX family)